MKTRTFCVHLGGHSHNVEADLFHQETHGANGEMGAITFYLDGRAVALFDIADVVCIMEIEPIVLTNGSPGTG